MFFKSHLKRKLKHVEKLVGVKSSNTLHLTKTKVANQLGKHQDINLVLNNDPIHLGIDDLLCHNFFFNFLILLKFSDL